MNVATLITALEAKGMTAGDILDVLKAVNPVEKPRSSAAERQARYREREAARKDENVTRDVTRYVTPPNKEKSPYNPLKEINPLTSSLRSECILARDGENELLEAGASPESLKSWKAVRRAKRAGPITPEVAKATIREAQKAGVSVQAAITECCERGWQGFKADWASRQPRAGPGSGAGTASDYISAELRKFSNEPDYSQGSVIDIGP